jgi:hypothetical protein
MGNPAPLPIGIPGDLYNTVNFTNDHPSLVGL